MKLWNPAEQVVWAGSSVESKQAGRAGATHSGGWTGEDQAADLAGKFEQEKILADKAVSDSIWSKVN